MGFPRTLLKALATASLALMLTATANATSIDYDYFAKVTDCPFGDPAGPCGTEAVPGPIFVGSEIIGFLTIDEAAVQAGVAGAADVLDFFFDVAGIFALSPLGGQIVGDMTKLNFDAAGQFIGGLFELILPDVGGPGIDGLLTDKFGDDGTGEWMITIAIPGGGDAFVNGGVAQLARSVPEPSTLALLGLGLGLLGFLRRRRVA